MAEEDKYTIQLNFKEHLGILYAKSFLKILGILFFAMELTFGKFTNLLVALVFLFIIYFTMPFSYRKDEPYKSSEAWFRMFAGLLIALVLFIFLSPGADLIGFSIMAVAFIIASLVVAFASSGVKNKIIIIVISILVGSVFTAIILPLLRTFYPAALPEAAPLFFISLAFLATAPKVIEGEGREKIEIMISKGAKDFADKITGDNMESFGTGLFLSLSIFAGAQILLWMKGNLQLVLAGVWIISTMIGAISGREARPYIGLIMIPFAILAFSFQYTGIIGTAVFGPYWTTIYNFGTTVGAPLGQAFDAVGANVGNAWLVITCGPQCAIQPPPPSTAEKSTSALEFLNFQAINYRSGTPEIDPQLPLIGQIELENQGDFVASDVFVKMKPPEIADPKKVSLNLPRGEISPLANDGCVFTSCLGSDENFAAGTQGACTWSGESAPKNKKILQFKCGSRNNNFASWSLDLNNCECRDPRNGNKITILDCGRDCDLMASRTAIGKCECYTVMSPSYSSQIDCESLGGCGSASCNAACNGGAQKVIKTYSKAGWNLNIGFDYNFSYNTDASLPVRIMEKKEFEKRLTAGQLQLEDKEPVYSGGPVSVGIWVGKQPLRTGETVFGYVYLSNNGGGIVKKDNSLLKISFANLQNSNIEFVSKPNVVSVSYHFKGGCSNYDEQQAAIFCELKEDLQPKAQPQITFTFSVKIKDSAPEKTVILPASWKYKYEAENVLQFPIVNAPPQ